MSCTGTGTGIPIGHTVKQNTTVQTLLQMYRYGHDGTRCTRSLPVPKFWFKRNRAQASLPSRWLLGLGSRLRSNRDLAHRRSRSLAQPRCLTCPHGCPTRASLISSGRLRTSPIRSTHKKVVFPNGHMAACAATADCPAVLAGPSHGLATQAKQHTAQITIQASNRH